MLKQLQPEHAQFPIREDGRETLEVHVASVCIRHNNGRIEVLAAKRSPNRSLFPRKWECGGGMVRRGESFDAAIKRQIFEEFGLDIERVRVLEVYEISVPDRRQPIIPGVRFLCIAKAGKTRLNKREFTTYKWVPLPVPANLDWISGLKEKLDEVYEMFGKIKPKDIEHVTRPIGFITKSENKPRNSNPEPTKNQKARA